MEVISLNTNKQKVAVIDSYKSFIWNDRYEDLGDFELYIPASAVDTLANIHQDYYIQCSESDRTMIVEKVNYKTDLENGNFVIISGRSLESILQRRIVWNDDGSITQVTLTKILDPKDDSEDSGSQFFVWQAIEYLLKLYIIDPEIVDNKAWRKIPNFEFEVPNDPEIALKMMSPCSYQGDNLYDVIKSICESYEFSFKITMDSETKKFVFSLYKGVSHLASQTENPYVCFSTDFDNLTSSDSSLDMSTYKNMAYYRGTGSKYVVKYFSPNDLAVEAGYVRIIGRAVWACKTDYPDAWCPDEFDKDTTYTKFSWSTEKLTDKNAISRTEIFGSLLTEDRNYYLSTEWQSCGEEEDDKYSYILLYSPNYEEEDRYYVCKTAGKYNHFNPEKWEPVSIKAFFTTNVTAPNYDITKEYKVEDDDLCTYDSKMYACIKDIPKAEEYDATKTYSIGDYCLHESHKYKCSVDISEAEEWNSNHWTQEDWDSTAWLRVVKCYATVNNKRKEVSEYWDKAETWKNHHQYKKNDFVTFDNSKRDGKITIYRKSEDDARYAAKKKYEQNAVVWYKPKNGTYNMYVRKKYKAGKISGKNGASPTKQKYWKKLTDKYNIFDAQQWEALDDIELESYDVYGSVQDSMVSGLNRREMFVDVTSVPSSYDYFYNDKKEETVSWIVNDGVFTATVKDMALAELTTPSNRMTKGLAAEIEYNTNFKYRKDYNIGDVVEVRDIYGYYDSVRVKEFIISDDDSGTKCYPTFEAVEASTITTRYLEVNDELRDNTLLVKIPESTRFTKKEVIATSVKGDTTYYLMSFVKKVETDIDGKEPDAKVKRDLHLVAWTTTPDDIYINYEPQEIDDLVKHHPTLIGEPLFYVDVDAETNMQLPGILFPSWSPPSGTDLGVIEEVDTDTSQYYNILIANI